MDSGIYKILNIVTGDFYIGSTSNLKQRSRTHKYLLKNNKHYNKHLQAAYNKYGIDNIKIITLETCERETLKSREQYYIDTLIPIYNKSKKADSYTDVIFSKESLAKLSLVNKGKKLSNVCIERMKETWKETRNTHPLSKLSDEKVKDLIKRFNTDTSIAELANIYSVSRHTILGVLSGRKWTDLNYLVDQSKWSKFKRKRVCIV